MYSLTRTTGTSSKTIQIQHEGRLGSVDSVALGFRFVVFSHKAKLASASGVETGHSLVRPAVWVLSRGPQNDAGLAAFRIYLLSTCQLTVRTPSTYYSYLNHVQRL